MNKHELIDLILPEDIEVDGIIELIETGAFGISMESITDSEVESIWELDIDTLIPIFDDIDGWSEPIEYIDGSFSDAMKFHLCEQINIYELIEGEQYMYVDIIYQHLECMDVDELIDLAERIEVIKEV